MLRGSASSTLERLGLTAGLHGTGPHHLQVRLTAISGLRVPQDIAATLRPFFLLTDSQGNKLATTGNLPAPSGASWSSCLGQPGDVSLQSPGVLEWACDMGQLQGQGLKVQLWHDAPALMGQKDECLAEGWLPLQAFLSLPPGGVSSSGGALLQCELKALPGRLITTTRTETKQGPEGAQRVSVSTTAPSTGIASELACTVACVISRLDAPPPPPARAEQAQVKRTTTTTTTTTVEKNPSVTNTGLGQPAQAEPSSGIGSRLGLPPARTIL